MNLCVAEAVRREHVASRLLEAYFAITERKGHRGHTLEVRVSNAPGHRAVPQLRVRLHRRPPRLLQRRPRGRGHHVEGLGRGQRVTAAAATGRSCARRPHPLPSRRPATTRARRSCAGARCSSSIVSSQNELHAQFGGVVPEVASRRHTELVNEVVAEAMSRGRRRLGRPRGRRRHAGPGPHRRAARRAGGGQVARLPPPPAADPREPPAGAHRRQLRPRRGGAVRVPRRQRRAHAARRGRGGRALPRRRQDHGRRRRRGLRQGRPAARPRLPGRQGARRSWRRAATPGFARFPRAVPRGRGFSFSGLKTALLYDLQGPRRGGDRGAPRRHRRLLPGGDRAPAGGEDGGRAPPPRACAASPSPAAWPPTPACAAR